MAKNNSASEAEVKPSTSGDQSSSGFQLPKIFDFTLLTQSKDGKDTGGKVYNYFWKVFDFRNGRTLE